MMAKSFGDDDLDERDDDVSDESSDEKSNDDNVDESDKVLLEVTAGYKEVANINPKSAEHR